MQIGEKLAGEVADRQAPGPLQRREQAVAGKGIKGGAVAGAVGQNLIEEPESARAADSCRKLGPQDREVDAGEVEADVGLQHPAVAGGGRSEAA